MADVVMGWLDRIVNVNFGSFQLYIVAAASEGSANSDGLAPPSITITQKNAPQDNVGFKKVDETRDPQSHTSPDTTINETVYTIWNPAVPLPDSDDINTVLSFGPHSGAISWVGQFMELHQNIIDDLRLFESPPIIVREDGTFDSFADAQAAIKYMSKTTIDSWFRSDGTVVDAGFINNFAVGIPVTIHNHGTSLASNVVKSLYNVPAKGEFSVNVSCTGDASQSHCNVGLFTTQKKPFKKVAEADQAQADAGAGANHGGQTEGSGSTTSGSHTYTVKFDASVKPPTVTVS